MKYNVFILYLLSKCFFLFTVFYTHYLPMSISIYLSVSIYLIYLYIYLALSVYQSISIYISINLSVYLYLSINLSIIPFHALSHALFNRVLLAKIRLLCPFLPPVFPLRNSHDILYGFIPLIIFNILFRIFI